MTNKQSKPIKEIFDGVEYLTSFTYTSKGILYTLSHVDSSGKSHSIYFTSSYDYVEYKAFLCHKNEILSHIKI